MQRAPDVLWLSGESRPELLVARARQLAQGGAHVIVGTFSMLAEASLRQLLGEDTAHLRLVDAARLDAGQVVQWAGPNAPVQVLVAGYGPHPAAEEQLLKRLDGPPAGPISVEFNASLDDPELKAIVTPALRKLLETIGVQPGEPIQHPMISRAVANARAARHKPTGSQR
ncbi:MAG TPA: hypothetical protein VM074_10610 [Solimonas sp.]|nr:hypothetical protein [Solimonas sp.]